MLNLGVKGLTLVEVDEMVVLVVLVVVVDCNGCSCGGGSRCGRYLFGRS